MPRPETYTQASLASTVSHSRLPLQGRLDTRVFRRAWQGSQQNQAAVSEWGKRASGQQCLPLRRERRAVTAASETRVGEALLVAVHVFIDRKRDPLDTPVEWTEMGPGQLKSKPGTRKNTAGRGGPSRCCWGPLSEQGKGAWGARRKARLPQSLRSGAADAVAAAVPAGASVTSGPSHLQEFILLNNLFPFFLPEVLSVKWRLHWNNYTLCLRPPAPVRADRLTRPAFPQRAVQPALGPLGDA